MARKPEQLVWDSLRLKSLGKVLFQRHEDKYSAGIPDLSGVFRGVQFWCELKSAPEGSGRLLLRQRQLNWMAERSTHGVPCILLARRGPHEWAGCLVTNGNHPELSRNIDFGQLAFLGRSDVCPVYLIEKLIEDVKHG